MPIYEYRCESCGAELEKIQKFSDAPLTDCPSCGKASLKKLVSASSFRLKGSGWYETDFKNKSKPASGAKTATPAGTGTNTGNSDKDNSASSKSGDTGSQDKKESKGSDKASASSGKDSKN